MSMVKVEKLNIQTQAVYFHGNRSHKTRSSMSNSHMEKQILTDVAFAVEEGEIFGIVGESGAGKSMCMKAIMGILPENILKTGTIEVQQKEIAYIFQDTSGCLNPTMKIGKQLVETIVCHEACDKKEAKQRALQLLDTVGITNPISCMKKYPFTCSGGMRQRVVIAIALACKSRILIADEPTAALDASVRLQIMQVLLKVVQERHLTLLLVSHDIGLIMGMCHRMMVMAKGKIVEIGEVGEIWNNPKSPYTKRLLRDSNYENYQIDQTSARPAISGISGISGIEATDSVELTSEVEASSFLQLKHVWKQFALKDVSLHLVKGERYCLVGESGSGKTTLGRIIMGLLPPDQGEVWYQGKRIDHLSEREKRNYWKEAQMIFQDPYHTLNPVHTIRNALMEIAPASLVEETLQQVGLEASLWDKYPGALSGGQCQRVGIARVLLLDPKLLVGDEPTSALDTTVRKEIMELLCHIQKENALTLFLIAHDMEQVKRIGNRVGILYDGMLMEEGIVEEVLEEPWHPYTRELMQAASALTTGKKKIKPKVVYQKIITDNAHTGCPYVGRCRYEVERCQRENPECYQYGNHRVRCFLYAPEQMAMRKHGAHVKSQL